MVSSIWFILVLSTLLGFLAGLGVGGGSLLIIWVSLILHMPHEQARILNLLFFLPAALVTTAFRWKQGTLNWKKILPGIIIGCTAAFLFSMLSTKLDIHLLKKLFGIILLATGTKEILYRPKK